MGKPSRDKGNRREREIVTAHLEIGVTARRIPLSGAMDGFDGDVQVCLEGRHEPLIAEVKARKSGEGFKTLEGWLGKNDALFLVRDRAKPVVVLPWSTYAELIARRA